MGLQILANKLKKRGIEDRAHNHAEARALCVCKRQAGFIRSEKDAASGESRGSIVERAVRFG